MFAGISGLVLSFLFMVLYMTGGKAVSGAQGNCRDSSRECRGSGVQRCAGVVQNLPVLGLQACDNHGREHAVCRLALPQPVRITLVHPALKIVAPSGPPPLSWARHACILTRASPARYVPPQARGKVAAIIDGLWFIFWLAGGQRRGKGCPLPLPFTLLYTVPCFPAVVAVCDFRSLP